MRTKCLTQGCCGRNAPQLLSLRFPNKIFHLFQAFELALALWSQDCFFSFYPSSMARYPWLRPSVHLGATVCLQHWQSRSSNSWEMLRIYSMSRVWDSQWPFHSAPYPETFPREHQKWQDPDYSAYCWRRAHTWFWFKHTLKAACLVYAVLWRIMWCGRRWWKMAVETSRLRRTNRDPIDAPDQQLGVLTQTVCVVYLFTYIPVYTVLCAFFAFTNIAVVVFKETIVWLLCSSKHQSLWILKSLPLSQVSSNFCQFTLTKLNLL